MRKNDYLRLLALVAFLALTAVVLAGAVYDRSTVTLGTATGTATWTNTWKYSAVELKRLWVIGGLAAADTCTVARVSSDNLYTQSVGTVTVAANAGNTASFTAAYLKYGDKLTFAGTATTGGTVLIEYEVQQP